MNAPAVSMDFDLSQAEQLLRTKALQFGFERFGIARVENIPAMAHYAAWLKKGYHAGMDYLVRHAGKKNDPGKIVAGAKSIFVCAANYNTAAPRSTDPAAPAQAWISRYAWGDDYHELLKARIAELNEYWLSICDNRFTGRYYVDTGPVLERAWAEKAGIGWTGKNCCIINKELGSWLFLAVIITDARIPASNQVADHCGSCTACIDACPTNALRAPYILDANRCISYQTIENKGKIPTELQPGIGRQIFGCDICQDVCPWNRKAATSDAAEFKARAGLINPKIHDLLQLDEARFRLLFRKSPVKRTKFRGFMRNVLLAAANSGDRSLIASIEKFTQHEDLLIRQQAVRSLNRLKAKIKQRPE